LKKLHTITPIQICDHDMAPTRGGMPGPFVSKAETDLHVYTAIGCGGQRSAANSTNEAEAGIKR
jgi:hypothetical protein